MRIARLERLGSLLVRANLNDKTVNLQHELDWAASFYWSRKLTHPTADRTPIAAALRRVCSRDVELDKYYKRVLHRSNSLSFQAMPHPVALSR